MTTLTMDRAHDEAMGGDPDPVERPRRRSFPADYKLAILDEYERCAGDGDKGALLRREGLYSSQILDWRRARDTAARAGLGPKARPPRVSAEAAELVRQRRRADRAEADLTKARLVIEIQGKASELLEQLLTESAQDPRQQP